jgi:hypothetical protein
MKTTLRYVPMVLAFIFAHLHVSCTAPVRRQPTALVAVRVVGGGPPTIQQTTTVHRAIGGFLAKAGLRFADRLADADFVVNIDFVPDAGDQYIGRVKIIGFESTSRLRRLNGDELSAEANEWAQKLRYYEQWIERQAKEST